MAVYKDIFAKKLNDLLTLSEAALIEAGTPAGLVSLAPGGQVAWDNCCEGGGQLWVRMIEVFPSGRPFPSMDTSQKCGVTLLGMRVGVGIVRCAHTLNDEGVPPTAEQMSADTLEMTQDAATLLGVLSCEMESRLGNMILKIERWTPQGPLGGCAGGEWTATISVNPCSCG